MRVRLKADLFIRTVIEVEGKIDSSNADVFYDEVSKLRKEHTNGFLVLDFDKVDYITSAGLRSLLKLQKEDKRKILLKNLSDELMKIMLISGFDQLLFLERKLQNISINDSVILERINLHTLEKCTKDDEKCLEKIDKHLRTVYIDGCEEMARGTKGTIYRFEEDKIIKVFNNGTALSDVVLERNLSKKALLLGVPTAITFDIVKVNDSYGVIFEMLNADTLSQAINKYSENYDKYMKSYEGILEKLHTTISNDHTIPDAKKVYISYIEKSREFYNNEEIDLMKNIIENIPDQNTLVHRDYHPNNLLVTNEEMLLIDLADLSKGHPIFDLISLGTMANLAEMEPIASEAAVGLSADKILKLWNDFLHLYFKNKSEDEIKEMELQFRFLAGINIALTPATRPEMDKNIIAGCIQDAKNNFLPKAKNFIGNIKW